MFKLLHTVYLLLLLYYIFLISLYKRPGQSNLFFGLKLVYNAEKYPFNGACIYGGGWGQTPVFSVKIKILYVVANISKKPYALELPRYRENVFFPSKKDNVCPPHKSRRFSKYKQRMFSVRFMPCHGDFVTFFCKRKRQPSSVEWYEKYNYENVQI